MDVESWAVESTTHRKPRKHREEKNVYGQIKQSRPVLRAFWGQDSQSTSQSVRPPTYKLSFPSKIMYLLPKIFSDIILNQPGFADFNKSRTISSCRIVQNGSRQQNCTLNRTTIL